MAAAAPMVPVELADSMRCCLCEAYLSVPPILIDPKSAKYTCGRCVPVLVLQGRIRDTMFEMLAGPMSFPCMYARRGCCAKKSFGAEVRLHEDLCTFRFSSCEIRGGLGLNPVTTPYVSEGFLEDTFSPEPQTDDPEDHFHHVYEPGPEPNITEWLARGDYYHNFNQNEGFLDGDYNPTLESDSTVGLFEGDNTLDFEPGQDGDLVIPVHNPELEPDDAAGLFEGVNNFNLGPDYFSNADHGYQGYVVCHYNGSWGSDYDEDNWYF